jgi:hypothetical protein
MLKKLFMFGINPFGLSLEGKGIFAGSCSVAQAGLERTFSFISFQSAGITSVYYHIGLLAWFVASILFIC